MEKILLTENQKYLYGKLSDLDKLISDIIKPKLFKKIKIDDAIKVIEEKNETRREFWSSVNKENENFIGKRNLESDGFYVWENK